ncbi:MAG: caspase, EACC1-associated type [Candidatus Electronema sp. VV]
MANKRYAILIASSRYPDEPGLTALRCPENDVDALNEVLSSPDFGQFSTIVVFKNKPSHEILEQLETVLAEVGKDDLVLIYFSGHGKLNPSGKLCLATVNTKPKKLGSTSIPAATITSFFEHSNVQRKILILDCCYSDAIGEEFRGGVDDQLQIMAKGQGTFIMTASTGIQVAVEKEGDQLGLFTKHLVDGIRSGEADRDEDGEIDIHELYQHVYEKVRAEGAQEPMKWDLNARGRMIIAKSRRAADEQQKTERSLHLFAANGLLSSRIIIDAVETLHIPKKNLTDRDQVRIDLIEQMVENKISKDEFIKRWIGQNPQQGDIVQEETTGMEFVYIPSGCFAMGSPSGEDGRDKDEDIHEVYLDAFWIGKYPVTQGQWKKIAGYNPSKFKKGDEYPVEQVSWKDVQTFVLNLNEKTGNNYRLPTEAEWEYACRAGSVGMRYDDIDNIAWHRENSTSTSPVGGKKQNIFGLYDMLGNVWEWCSDLYLNNYYMFSPKQNPAGPSLNMYCAIRSDNWCGIRPYNVIRGGCWQSAPKKIRAAYRFRFAPDDCHDGLGFRLVLPV